MPLQFQNVPITFTGGIDRSNPYLVSPRKMLFLQNALWEDEQTLTRRDGVQSISLSAKITTVPAPYTETNVNFTGQPYRLAQNQGALLLEGINGLFSRVPYNGTVASPSDSPSMLRAATYSPSTGRTDFTRSQVDTVYVSTFDGIGTDGAPLQKTFDYGRVTYNDRVYSMWVHQQDVNNKPIHVEIWDEGEMSTAPPGAGRSKLIDITLPGTTLTYNPRVLCYSTGFYVLAVDNAASLKIFLKHDLVTATTSYPTVATAAILDVGFDAIVDVDDQIVWTYELAAGGLRVAKVNAGNTAESFGATFAAEVGVLNPSLVPYTSAGNRFFGVFFSRSGSNTILRSVYLSAAAASATGGTYNAGALVGRVTGVDFSAAGAEMAVFFDQGVDAAILLQDIRFTKATLAVASGPYSLSGHARVFGRAQVSGTRLLVPSVSGIDRSYPSIYIIVGNTDPAVYSATGGLTAITMARIHWGAAGYYGTGVELQKRVPSTFIDSAGALVLGVTRWSSQAFSSQGQVQSGTQLWQARCDFQTQDIGYVETARTTILAGSCPQVYDGASFSESGFNERPVISAVTPTAAGGNLSAGDYRVACTFAWRDAKGNQYESAPSDIATFTSGAAGRYTVTVSDYTLGSKFLAGVQTRIYRSLAGSTTGLLYYDDVATANVLSLGQTDALITRNTVLYTVLGYLPNEPMPACRVAVEHQNRIWCAGGEDGQVIYFSQPISQDIFPEFNRLLNRRIPASAGRVVNIVSLDDKLVIFCEKRIGFIYGTGPDRTGGQDGYSQFIEAVSGYSVSWTEPHSIVRATDGVWFKSGFGARLLTRGMQIAKGQDGTDLASEMDTQFNSVTVIRAVLSDNAQQVRFFVRTSTSTTNTFVLCYDQLYGQWSQLRGTPYTGCIDAVSLGTQFYHIAFVSSNPDLRLESPVFNEDFTNAAGSLAITSIFNSAWLAMSGLQGFQRVTRLQIMGQLKDSGNAAPRIATSVYINYDEITAFPVIADTLFPLAAGTEPIPFLQVEAQLPVQKCQSMLISTTFTSGTGDDASKWHMTAMSLRIGTKQGRMKLPTSQRRGA